MEQDTGNTRMESHESNLKKRKLETRFSSSSSNGSTLSLQSPELNQFVSALGLHQLSAMAPFGIAATSNSYFTQPASSTELPVAVLQIVNGVLAEFGSNDPNLVEAVSSVAKRIYRMMLNQQNQIQLALQRQQRNESQQQQPPTIEAQPQHQDRGHSSKEHTSHLHQHQEKSHQSAQAHVVFKDTDVAQSLGLLKYFSSEVDPKRAEMLSSFLASPKLSPSNHLDPASLKLQAPFSLSSSVPSLQVHRMNAQDPNGTTRNEPPHIHLAEATAQNCKTPQETPTGSVLQSYYSGDSTTSNALPTSPMSGISSALVTPSDNTANLVDSSPISRKVIDGANVLNGQVASTLTDASHISTPTVPSSPPVPSTNPATAIPPTLDAIAQRQMLDRRYSSTSMVTSEGQKSTCSTKYDEDSSDESDDSGDDVPNGGRWTEEQNKALVEAIDKFGAKNWRDIAKMVPGRDHVQCLQRWSKVLRPGLKKGQWSEREDQLLKDLVGGSSPKWVYIASQIPGRTAKQCRERWSLNLDPSINRSPWTQEEDNLLVSLQQTMGSKWAEIKCQFHGRTENSVKTRYKSLMRQKARSWTVEQDQKLISLFEKYGKDWKKISDELSGRTRNAVKTRFKELAKIRTGCLQQDLSRPVYTNGNGNDPRSDSDSMTPSPLAPMTPGQPHDMQQQQQYVNVHQHHHQRISSPETVGHMGNSKLQSPTDFLEHHSELHAKAMQQT